MSFVLVALASTACTTEPSASAPPTEPPTIVAPAPSIAPVEPAGVAPVPTTEIAPPPPATLPSPAGEEAPVDLVHALRSTVSVSSAYRDVHAQAQRLIDGDLETAWNSRTGDLVGAWIEVRLPGGEDTVVTSIAMTVGFTHTTDTDDLFTGNHRVSYVTVTHDGEAFGTYTLDPESRELQSFPVRGSGGTYRLVISGVVPGTRTDWREVCISELRVMGHAPGSAEGEFTPVVGVGEDAEETAAAAAGPAPTFPTFAVPAPAATAGALAGLETTLRDAGLTRLVRRNDVLESWRDGQPRLAGASGTDTSGTWLCVEPPDAPPRCITVSTSAIDCYGVFHRDGDVPSIATSCRDADGWVDVTLPLSGPARASHRAADSDDVAHGAPLPEPAMRATPPWLATLEDVEIASGYATIAATTGGWLTVCTLRPSLRCAAPAIVTPMLREHVTFDTVSPMFGNVYGVEYSWEAVNGELSELGGGGVFVRAEASLELLVTMVTYLEHRRTLEPGTEAADTLRMESFAMDMLTENCFEAGVPTGERRRVEADGSERALGTLRFTRAPDTLPATGLVDPLTVSMHGAWTILPHGGLRRRARACPEE